MLFEHRADRELDPRCVRVALAREIRGDFEAIPVLCVESDATSQSGTVLDAPTVRRGLRTTIIGPSRRSSARGSYWMSPIPFIG